MAIWRKFKYLKATYSGWPAISGTAVAPATGSTRLWLQAVPAGGKEASLIELYVGLLRAGTFRQTVPGSSSYSRVEAATEPGEILSDDTKINQAEIPDLHR